MNYSDEFICCPLCLSEISFPLPEVQARELAERIKTSSNIKKVLCQIGRDEWIIYFEKKDII